LLIRLIPWIARQPFAPCHWGPISSAAPYVLTAVNLAVGGIAGDVWLLLRDDCSRLRFSRHQKASTRRRRLYRIPPPEWRSAEPGAPDPTHQVLRITPPPSTAFQRNDSLYTWLRPAPAACLRCVDINAYYLERRDSVWCEAAL
jgi:hypothetical protein